MQFSAAFLTTLSCINTIAIGAAQRSNSESQIRRRGVNLAQLSDYYEDALFEARQERWDDEGFNQIFVRNSHGKKCDELGRSIDGFANSWFNTCYLSIVFNETLKDRYEKAAESEKNELEKKYNEGKTLKCTALEMWKTKYLDTVNEGTFRPREVRLEHHVPEKICVAKTTPRS